MNDVLYLVGQFFAAYNDMNAAVDDINSVIEAANKGYSWPHHAGWTDLQCQLYVALPKHGWYRLLAKERIP